MHTKTENRAEDQARAQVATIVEMVDALDVDYDRLQELRDKRDTGHYVAGWNMPGYMPDGEQAAFDTDTEAREYLADQMENQGEENESPIDPADIEECRNGDGEYGATFGNWHYWVTFEPCALADSNEAEELEELESAAGDCTSEDEARERILESPLSVEIRSGWASSAADFTPEKFLIVLCTGGPHVELIGDLDRGTPSRIRVLYSDWGTSGEYFPDADERAAIENYCEQFYFGE